MSVQDQRKRAREWAEKNIASTEPVQKKERQSISSSTTKSSSAKKAERSEQQNSIEDQRQSKSSSSKKPSSMSNVERAEQPNSIEDQRKRAREWADKQLLSKTRKLTDDNTEDKEITEISVHKSTTKNPDNTKIRKSVGDADVDGYTSNTSQKPRQSGRVSTPIGKSATDERTPKRVPTPVLPRSPNQNLETSLSNNKNKNMSPVSTNLPVDSVESDSEVEVISDRVYVPQSLSSSSLSLSEQRKKAKQWAEQQIKNKKGVVKEPEVFEVDELDENDIQQNIESSGDNLVESNTKPSPFGTSSSASATIVKEEFKKGPAGYSFFKIFFDIITMPITFPNVQTLCLIFASVILVLSILLALVFVLTNEPLNENEGPLVLFEPSISHAGTLTLSPLVNALNFPFRFMQEATQAISTYVVASMKASLFFIVAYLILSLIQLVIVVRYRRQAIARKLADTAKKLLREVHNGGPYPIAFLQEEVIEKLSEDQELMLKVLKPIDHWLLRLSCVAFPLTRILRSDVGSDIEADIVFVRQLWPKAVTQVSSDIRVQTGSHLFEGKSHRCWRFLGVIPSCKSSSASPSVASAVPDSSGGVLGSAGFYSAKALAGTK